MVSFSGYNSNTTRQMDEGIMGIYWLVACDEKEEFIYFNDIEGNYTKYPVGNRIGMLLCYLNFDSCWSKKNMRYVNDMSDEYYIIKEKYKNVTKDMIAGYNGFLLTFDEGDIVEEFILRNMLRYKDE